MGCAAGNFPIKIDTRKHTHTVRAYGMQELTKRQRQIVEFIDRTRHAFGGAPSTREIAEHFGFKSPGTVAEHLRLIRTKGALDSEPGQARSLRVVTPLSKLRRRVVD